METIKSVIKDVVRELERKKEAPGREDPGVWLKKVLTKRESGHIKFNYFKNGILNIKVDSSSWLYHLNLRKEDLLAKLRKKSEEIRDIRFHLGETQ